MTLTNDQFAKLDERHETMTDQRPPFDPDPPPWEDQDIRSSKSMDFPGNSIKKKSPGSQERRQSRVTEGAVLRKKIPGKNFSENFLAEDLKNVGAYILYEVLIPAAKSTLSDVVSSGIERLLYGGSSPSNRARSGGSPSVISYGNYYKKPERQQRALAPRESYSRPRVRQGFTDIIFERRGDAETVLSTLYDIIDTYGTASIADFYDLAGMSSTYIDFKYGWENLRNSAVERVREGFVLDLPRPIALN